MNNITNKLKKARESKGMSTVEMSERLGIARVTYYKYENNERSIPTDVAYKISAILDVSYEDIFLPSRVTIRNTNYN